MMGAQSRPAEQPCHDGQDLSVEQAALSYNSSTYLKTGCKHYSGVCRLSSWGKGGSSRWVHCPGQPEQPCHDGHDHSIEQGCSKGQPVRATEAQVEENDQRQE